MQVGDEPEQSPLQPMNRPPGVGAAVSVTTEPAGNGYCGCSGFTPAGEEVTAPAPLLLAPTTQCVVTNDAVTERAASSITVQVE